MKANTNHFCAKTSASIIFVQRSGSSLHSLSMFLTPSWDQYCRIASSCGIEFLLVHSTIDSLIPITNSSRESFLIFTLAQKSQPFPLQAPLTNTQYKVMT